PKLVGEPEPPATLDKQVGKHDSLLKAEMIAARRIDSRRKSKTVLSLGDDGSAEDIVRRIADRRGRIGLARKGGEAAMIAEDHQIIAPHIGQARQRTGMNGGHVIAFAE